ncbi:MAG: hypothetical protein D6816_04850 [Bacteroidetes bacterium]|nr:MAG: hypothetical protein D6816_04850 [Bacteroidota bacterium]
MLPVNHVVTSVETVNFFEEVRCIFETGLLRDQAKQSGTPTTALTSEEVRSCFRMGKGLDVMDYFRMVFKKVKGFSGTPFIPDVCYNVPTDTVYLLNEGIHRVSLGEHCDVMFFSLEKRLLIMFRFGVKLNNGEVENFATSPLPEKSDEYGHGKDRFNFIVDALSEIDQSHAAIAEQVARLKLMYYSMASPGGQNHTLN